MQHYSSDYAYLLFHLLVPTVYGIEIHIVLINGYKESTIAFKCYINYKFVEDL